MDQVFALDIAEDFVTGIILETGGKATVVSRYGVVGIEEGRLDEALGELLAQLGGGDGNCLVSISSGNIVFRNLVLPFQDRQKIEQILPLELEELTSFQGHEVHYDFLVGTGQADTTPVLTAILAKEKMAEILAALQGHGLDPERITVSGLPVVDDIVVRTDGENSFILVDIEGRRVTLFVVENGQVMLIRPLVLFQEEYAGFSLQEQSPDYFADKPELLAAAAERLNTELKQTLISFQRPYLWEEQVPCYISGSAGLAPLMFEQLQQKIETPTKKYDGAEQPLIKIEPFAGASWRNGLMSGALALGMSGNTHMAGLNFRCGDFRKPKSLKQVGRAGLIFALPIAVLVFAGVVFALIDFSRLTGEREALRTQIRDVFHETLPEVTRVVQPVQQLKVKIDEIRKLYNGGGRGEDSLRKVDLLAELSARIPEKLQIRFTRLVADEGDVRVRGETADFNTVDNVQKELQKSDLFNSVVISSANLAPQGGGVRFELKLEMK